MITIGCTACQKLSELDDLCASSDSSNPGSSVMCRHPHALAKI